MTKALGAEEAQGKKVRQADAGRGSGGVAVTAEGCQGRELVLDGKCFEDTGHRERQSWEQSVSGRVLMGCWG